MIFLSDAVKTKYHVWSNSSLFNNFGKILKGGKVYGLSVSQDFNHKNMKNFR